MAGRGLIWVERLSRWALAGIFFAAAVPKIMDPAGFASDISHYNLVPDVLVNPMAIVMPWIETVGAFALLTGFGAEGGLLLVTLMIFMFMGALGWAWSKGLDIDCGCFGHSDAKGHIGLAFLRDMGFLALCLFAAWMRKKRIRASR